MASGLRKPESAEVTVASTRLLDRASVERVLARAAELHAGALDAPEALSDEQLIEIGREVGLSADNLRQALAEERTRVAVPAERGLVGELFGGTVASANRIVDGSPASILAMLDSWMQKEELLRPKRRFADRLTWEARGDFVGSLQAAFNFGGRAYSLTTAGEVGATVSPVDARRVVVRLDATLRAARGRSVGWSAGLLGTGVAGSAVLIGVVSSLGGPLLIAAAGAGLWTGAGAAAAWGVARGQQNRLAKAQLALEQVLDRLEHGDMRKSANPLMDLISSISR
ncbi:MAG: hypothetical protein ACT4OZ_12510 [Gemmatimonadota bacterium]